MYPNAEKLNNLPASAPPSYTPGTLCRANGSRASADEPDTGASRGLPDVTDQVNDLRGKTVLLIDDEPLVLRAGVRMLRTLGCEVIGARSGREGIELFEANRDAVDLAVVDLIMPDMDGIATLERILDIDATVPVLLVSGYTWESAKMEVLSRRHGQVRFLSKPYQPDQLMAAVKKLLDRSARRRVDTGVG